MRLFLLIPFFAFQLSLASPIKVRLFSSLNVQSAIVNAKVGGYVLLAATADFRVLDTIFIPNDDAGHHVIHLKLVGAKIQVGTKDVSFGTYSHLKLVPRDAFNEFLIAVNGLDRLYEGQLLMRVFSNQLQLVNLLPLENYVAGVVEAEAGHVNEYEFFKAQAVLARTYALKNIQKHIKEGYHLKDDVSSQVFHGKAYLQNRHNIYSAVKETQGQVLVDSANTLIQGLFHANSGGHTANSQDVWTSHVPYLQGRPDPYSTLQPSATWVRKVPRKEVEDFFAARLVTSDRAALVHALGQFQQPTRQGHFVFQNKKLPLKEVRAQFKLRSTYFNIRTEGDFYVFEGRGNGHGVGLSQEGAMEMSKQGYCYDEILYFYFSKILLTEIPY